jgi:hypothetical protein
MEDAEDILESEEANEETESSSTEENTHVNRDELKKTASRPLPLALRYIFFQKWVKIPVPIY